MCLLAAHSESPLAAFGSKWANLGGLFLGRDANHESTVAGRGFCRSAFHAVRDVRPFHWFLADDLQTCSIKMKRLLNQFDGEELARRIIVPVTGRNVSSA